MKTLTSIAVAGLLAGCGANVSDPAPAPAQPATGTPAPAATPTPDVDVSLARLRGLSIFEVYGIPEEGNCYAGDTACLAHVKAPAAPRVATFTDAVVNAAAKAPSTEGLSDAANEANLAVLRKLNVVLVGQLIVEQPKNNPHCYNLPCPEDTAAAAAVNRDREGRLANIASALKP